MFYAKIGTSFVTDQGYGEHPVGLTKFGTANEAAANAATMCKLFPRIMGAVAVFEVAA